MIKIIYHGPWCPDGFTSAYCAWTVFREDAEYIPVDYSDPIPQFNPGDEVYILDFSFPRETMIAIEKIASKVVCLDHHKTAQENLLGLTFALFDMNKSGAVLSWEYWHSDKPIPDLIRYVEDRDLWRHNLPLTEEVYMGLREQERTFENWHRLAQMPDFVNFTSHIGKPLLIAKKKEVKAIAETAEWFVIAGFKVPVVAECNRYYSDVCNLLCKEFPEAPFAVAWRNQNGVRKWDFRSIGDFDVSAIARQFGGGGHKNAAGCSTSLGDHLW